MPYRSVGTVGTVTLKSEAVFIPRPARALTVGRYGRYGNPKKNYWPFCILLNLLIPLILLILLILFDPIDPTDLTDPI